MNFILLLIFLVSFIIAIIISKILNRIKDKVGTNIKYHSNQNGKYEFVLENNERIEVSRRLGKLYNTLFISVFVFFFIAMLAMVALFISGLVIPSIKNIISSVLSML
ncbi:hypothetical protein [Spirochaeta cellobiosiphila]|uniref:hypothetical protein n=1 Tax=Spirochaeta cellobiosiphila TaxID=504483 RepID=UPI0004901B23|nr:hypothetical protein [Spirochaeta cellobiosiphila]